MQRFALFLIMHETTQTWEALLLLSSLVCRGLLLFAEWCWRFVVVIAEKEALRCSDGELDNEQTD